MKNMKYVKTFEGFSVEMTNEEFEFFKKMKDKFSGWLDDKKKAALAKVQAYIEKEKEGKLKPQIDKLKAEFEKLPEEDKNKVLNGIPNTVGEDPTEGINVDSPEVKQLAESFSYRNNKMVFESLAINEGMSGKDIAMAICKWLGFTVAAVSFVLLIIAIIKIAIVGSGFGIVFAGISLGNMIGILMGTTLFGGILGGVGASFGEEEPVRPTGPRRPAGHRRR